MAKDVEILERLYKTIRSRRGKRAADSYTASLFAAGRAKIGRKLSEEALETVLAGLQESKKRLTSESADLIYHLFVLLAARGVTPGQVWKELKRREGTSGHVEKAARKPVRKRKG
jgi:phosphoribosyl-ATP pyrophosphohydrolase